MCQHLLNKTHTLADCNAQFSLYMHRFQHRSLIWIACSTHLSGETKKKSILKNSDKCWWWKLVAFVLMEIICIVNTSTLIVEWVWICVIMVSKQRCICKSKGYGFVLRYGVIEVFSWVISLAVVDSDKIGINVTTEQSTWSY